jgi:membrane fusion protein (multidrug efflux system)
VRCRIALAALASAWLFGCGGDEVEAETAKFTPVTVEPVVAVDLEERIEVPGQLLAKDRAEIAAEVGGQITGIGIEEGGAAKEGDEMLTIDPARRSLEHDSARAVADQARAQLREQEREFARVKKLLSQKVASQTQLDEAETELTLARSRLRAAEAQLGVAERALSDASVRAPFAGMIATRFVSRGEYVTPGQKLFELVSLDPIEVEFRLTEADSSRVASGQKVTVRVAPYPDETFTGQVTMIAPVIDERSRTLRVKARIDNRDGRLRPGLFARVDLGVAQRSDVTMIPEDAVLQRADGAIVFRANAENRVERVVVETGLIRDGMVEIARGIAPGDRIVVRGHFRLSDGQPVSVRTVTGEVIVDPIPDVAGSPR